MSRTTCSPARIGALLIGIVGLLGCNRTALLQIVRADPADPARYVEVPAGEISGLASVYRGGQAIVARPPFTLQQGDEIETGPDASAVIGLPNGGEVILQPLTRVRLGSLEVLFGKIFATVRGIFSAESKNVVAGVEGTQFLFEVDRQGEVRVVVLDGVVVCQSKTKSWSPIRLNPREAFVAASLALPPRVEPANPRELDELRTWVERVKQAPRSGYCCAGGRVYPGMSNQCPGLFAATLEGARQFCEFFQPGWCCDRGRVAQKTRAECSGEFFFDAQSARQRCAAMAEPTGWCCQHGRLTPETRSQCPGEFFFDAQSARQGCTGPAEPMGWCCQDGRVTPGTRGQCSAWFSDQRTAQAQCHPIIR